MEPRHQRELIRVSMVLGAVILLAAFFFLGWLFSSYDRNGQPNHASRYRELPVQQSGRTGIPPPGWLGNRYSLPAQTG